MSKAGLHRHTRQLKEEYPEELAMLLVELAEYNREKYQSPPHDTTQGAEQVRATGLTNVQQEYAGRVASKLADREEWACEECGENKITATRGVDGPGRCNACIFGRDE